LSTAKCLIDVTYYGSTAYGHSCVGNAFYDLNHCTNLVLSLCFASESVHGSKNDRPGSNEKVGRTNDSAGKSNSD